MSWDELLQGIFEGYFKLTDRFKKKRQRELITANHTVRLEDIVSKLTIIARAITGEAIEVIPAEREGGYKNRYFFLPVFFAEFDNFRDNLQFYLFRTLYLSVQRELNLNWQPGEKEKSLELSRQKALETAQIVLEKLFADFPAIQTIHQKLVTHYQAKTTEKQIPDFTFIYGKWMHNQADDNTADQLKNINQKVKKAIDEEIQTILKAKAVEEMQTLQVDKKQQADQVVHNYYEKVETLEEHKGGIWKDFDGDDELESHQNALDELKMSRTVRVDEDTHSVYQSEFMENITVSESVDINADDYYLTYDEWDYQKKSYKKDFCKFCANPL